MLISSRETGEERIAYFASKGKNGHLKLCNCIQKYKCDNKMFQMFTNNDLFDAKIRPFIENSYSS